MRARHEVLDEIFALFIELGAHDDQLDFPVLYAVAREGTATHDLDERRSEDMTSCSR